MINEDFIASFLSLKLIVGKFLSKTIYCEIMRIAQKLAVFT